MLLPPPQYGVSSPASINQRPLNPLQLMKINAKEGSLWNVYQKHGIQSKYVDLLDDSCYLFYKTYHILV